MTVPEAPTFTILLPLHRGPQLLPYAVASVQGQTRRDFELIILCDGAPKETAAVAQALAASDARIRVKLHPKGENRGERWRHLALHEARGKYICQLGDDDLWLPRHLAEVAVLLEAADFGHMLHVETRPDGTAVPFVGDLANPRTQQRLLHERINLSGPTCAAYRLAAYRALPEGWAPGPPEIWSDLTMWRRFLRRPGLTFATRYAVTAICLPTALRQDRTIEQRLAETQALAARLRDPAWRESYVGNALSQAAATLAATLRETEERDATVTVEADRRLALQAQELAQLEQRFRRAEARLAYVTRSRIWRLRQRVARLLGRP